MESEHSTRMIHNCTRTWAWMLCCVLERTARRVWGGLRTCENPIVLEKQLELRNRTIPRMAGKVLLTAKKPHFNRHASLYVQSVPWWTKWVVGNKHLFQKRFAREIADFPVSFKVTFLSGAEHLKWKPSLKGTPPGVPPSSVSTLAWFSLLLRKWLCEPRAELTCFYRPHSLIIW